MHSRDARWEGQMDTCKHAEKRTSRSFCRQVGINSGDTNDGQLVGHYNRHFHLRGMHHWLFIKILTLIYNEESIGDHTHSYNWSNCVFEKSEIRSSTDRPINTSWSADSTFVVKFVLVSNSALQQGCTGLLNHAQLCDDENPVWGHHYGLIVEDFRWSDNYCPQSWTLTEY